jgi:hypothetical protein
VPFSPSVPVVLLLHEGGWDEVLMVAIGLGLAYLVIVWTGRRSRDDVDDDGDDDGDAAVAEDVLDEPAREESGKPTKPS